MRDSRASSSRRRSPLQVGPYELLEEVGHGSCGRVWLARKPGQTGKYALKALIHGVDAEGTARFLREARLAARLSHPGIATCVDVGQDPNFGWPYLVLEFVQGTTLRDVLRRKGSLPPETAVELVARVAEAVHHAHTEGVVHRDLKPENIVIRDSDRAPVVLDFGLARELWLESDLTRAGDLVGTPYYMAPEQVRGQPVGPPADVWALGAILYELLAGARPFEAPTVSALTPLILAGNVTPPSALQPAIPQEVERVCLQALSLKPADRPASAQALAQALREAIEPRAAGAAAPPEGDDDEDPDRLLRLAVFGTALLVLGLGTGVGLATLRRRWRASPTPSAAASPSATPGRELLPTPADPPPPDPGPTAPARPTPTPAASQAPSPAPARPAPSPAVDVGPLLARAREALERGGLAAARAALEEAERGGAPAGELAALRAATQSAEQEQGRLAGRAMASYRGFAWSEGLEQLELAVQARPDAAILQAGLGNLLLAGGRLPEAIQAYQRAVELGLPPNGQTRDLERQLRELRQHQVRFQGQPFPGEQPLGAEWIPVEGGVWGVDQEGAVVGHGIGMGEYNFSARAWAGEELRDGPWKIEVELLLDPTREAEYAGVFLGGSTVGDMTLVYLFSHPDAMRQDDSPAMRQLKEKLGSWPKGLRVARLVQGRWQHILTTMVPIPDGVWGKLELTLGGGQLLVRAQGEQLPPIPLAGPPQGRVGLLKFYEGRPRFRGFQLRRAEAGQEAGGPR